MHDVLFDDQGALGYEDLAYAGRLGLDVERFAQDLQRRKHARRVARDTDAAEEMSAAGTPTFFVQRKAALRRVRPCDAEGHADARHARPLLTARTAGS